MLHNITIDFFRATSASILAKAASMLCPVIFDMVEDQYDPVIFLAVSALPTVVIKYSIL